MLERLLITGAAGGLGSMSRKRLTHLARHLRLSDIVAVTAETAQEEAMTCDLGDASAVDTLVEGCDAILHFGGISTENTFDKILNANIVGVFNLYEAARKHGVKRVLFASSNHSVGFHRQDNFIDADATFRPDGLYGVSKCYGETIAMLYHDKFGIETARVRIGSCFPEPRDVRMLSSWLSYDDFVRLAERVFTAPYLGCPVIYGISNNSARWWDNSKVSYLGWAPQDNAETFRAKVEAAGPMPAKDDPLVIYQGGMYTQDDVRAK